MLMKTATRRFLKSPLVDLLVGPLNEPGKARTELRKLMDRLPDSPAAANARLALTELISREAPE